MNDDIKKDDVNQDDEFASLDDFLNETDTDDAFPLDDDDEFAQYEAPKKKGGFGKLLGYTALIALLGVGGYAAYKYIPQLAGTSELSDFEKNMMARADNFSDELPQAYNEPDMGVQSNETPMPDASDSNSIQGQDVVIIEDNGQLNADDDLSISDVNVTIIPEDEPLPDDVAAMIGENSNASVAIINDGDETPAAATIAEALDMANNAEAVEEVESKVDSEIAQAFDKDFPVETMPVESVELVEEEDMPSTFNRIPAMPMTSSFDEVETADDDIAVVDEVEASIEENVPEMMMDEVETTQSETILVTEEPSEPVIEIEDNATNTAEEASIDNDDENLVTETVSEFPDVDEDLIEDVSAEIVEEVETPVVAVQEEIVADKVPSAPKLAPEPVVAAPIITKKVAVKPAPVVEKYSLNNEDQLNATVDPRVVEGQRALTAGDFETANRIFNAVLASNPSNVHALTGKQMAVSKIRVPMPQQQVAPQATPMQRETPDVDAPLERSMPDATKQIINAPVQATSVTSLPTVDKKIVAPADSVEALLLQMNTNPRDANAAVDLAKAYAQAGQTAKAVEWYQKALQLDALYQTGINRMAVYDALAGLQ